MHDRDNKNNSTLQPRLIRVKNAPRYLGTNINYFNKYIRPSLPSIRYGKHSIAFDRVDLDGWVEQNKGRGELRPITRGDLLWDEKEHPASTSAEANGTLTNASAGNEFWKMLEQIRSKKQKKS